MQDRGSAILAIQVLIMLAETLTVLDIECMDSFQGQSDDRRPRRTDSFVRDVLLTTQPEKRPFSHGLLRVITRRLMRNAHGGNNQRGPALEAPLKWLACGLAGGAHGRR